MVVTPGVAAGAPQVEDGSGVKKDMSPTANQDQKMFASMSDLNFIAATVAANNLTAPLAGNKLSQLANKANDSVIDEEDDVAAAPH